MKYVGWTLQLNTIVGSLTAKGVTEPLPKAFVSMTVPGYSSLVNRELNLRYRLK